jgi:hypothetical protein
MRSSLVVHVGLVVAGVLGVAPAAHAQTDAGSDPREEAGQTQLEVGLVVGRQGGGVGAQIGYAVAPNLLVQAQVATIDTTDFFSQRTAASQGVVMAFEPRLVAYLTPGNRMLAGLGVSHVEEGDGLSSTWLDVDMLDYQYVSPYHFMFEIGGGANLGLSGEEGHGAGGLFGGTDPLPPQASSGVWSPSVHTNIGGWF